MQKGGRFLKKVEKKKGKGRKVTFLIIGLVLVLLISGAAFGIAYFNGALDKIKHVEVPKVDYGNPTLETTLPQDTADETTESTVATTEPHIASSEDYINFLVVGQASRAGEVERFADTMILCTVNTYEKTLTMTSLLRDSFVKMPDYRGRYGGRIKLTTIYHLGSVYGDGVAGSMELMNMTLFNNFGIEVDHNFEVDFDAFVKVVDMLGGVELEITQAEADYLNADDTWVYYDIQPGFASIDGCTALSYARMRKAEGDNESDIVRTERQRKLVSALIGKLKSRSLSDLNKIAQEVLPMITTSMTKSEITDMLLKLLPILPDLTIAKGGSCPAEYKGDMVDIYSDGMMHSVLRFDVASTTKTMREITEGETEPSPQP